MPLTPALSEHHPQRPLTHSLPTNPTTPPILLQQPTSPPLTAAPSYAPDNPAAPTAFGIAPARMRYQQLLKQFKPTQQLAFTVEHALLTEDMQRLHSRQPSFKAFVQAQLEAAFPAIRPLNAEQISFNRYRVDDDGESLASAEPLMTALARMIRDIQASPNTLRRPERGIRTEFSHAQTPAVTEGSLHSIARNIATQYPQALEEYWSTQQPVENQPSVQMSPQSQLLTLHKQQLSILAALRVSDGTLSAAGKELIDNALRYPTLEAREKKFADGDRLGVYPITVDDKTERGAMLPGAFLITRQDGSSATPPTWPKGRTLELNDKNGPVVIYTPSEGFEEFATPAQALQALANSLNQGATRAKLLVQALSPHLQNGPDPITGQDLMSSVEPSSGDVLAEAMSWMLRRQHADINTHLSTALKPADTVNPLLDSTSLQGIDNAADWSYLLDGSNAMLARDAKLVDKNQPEWLKNLTPIQEAVFMQLEQTQESSLDTLAPLLEKIPSLGSFSRDRLNAAIKKRYPNAQVDADKLMVQVHTRTGVHGGRGTGQPLYSRQDPVSLTDLALKNPTGFPANERGTFTDIKMTLALVDTQGRPVLDPSGEPVSLDTDTLKQLVNAADVGGEYTKLLKQEMDPDAVSGSAAQLRTAWKANLRDAMEQEAYLAELNPDAYKEQATENPTTKRAALLVDAVLSNPDPATRSQVEGKTVVAHSLIHRGLAVQGVMVIGNQTDSSLALYTPKAPDGITFREVTDHKALDALLGKEGWAAYIAKRKSPVSKDDVAEFKDAIKSNLFNPMKLLSSEVLVSSVKLLGGATSLKPIEGNVQDHLYKQHVQMVIDRADHQSVSSAEVARQSTLNKIEFGVEVALIFADLVPVLGKGVSTGVRLGKAGVTALRAHSRILPHLIKKPGLARAIYSDFTLAASGISNVRAAPMRPVFKSSTVGALTPRPGPRALPAPDSLPPAIASTSTGASAVAMPRLTNLSPPTRDLSAYAVSEEIISGQPLRSNGTYNVDGNSYIRFTDSTLVSRVYQIDSAFHARSGWVNILDPTIPSTAPRSSRIVASVQHAGKGEWRLNQLPGGMPTRVAVPGAPSAGAEAPAGKRLPDAEYLSINNGRLVEADFTTKNLPVARAWFRRDLHRFYQNMITGGQMPPRPPRPEIAPGTSPGDLLRRAYEISDVVVLGESHNEIASFQMIKENMQALKEAGVTTFYIENTETNATGQLRDAGMGAYRPSGASPTLSELVQLAKANGITVRSLEHRYLTRHADMPDFLKGVGDNDRGITRLQEVNYYATRILQNRKPGEKVLVLAGRAHMNTTRNVPGLAELNGGVGIGVYPDTAFNKSVAISGPSVRRDPGAVVTGSHTAGDYQVFQKVT